MNSLKFSDIPHQKIILKHLYNMQQSNKMCDMTLEVENQEIHVHKLVLTALSPYFSALVNTDFKENIENKIKFSDISKVTLETMIKFIYTGDIEINDTNVYEIMSAANRFQISFLKSPITYYLITSLDTTNSLETLAYAHLYNYDEVYCETLKFIVNNFHFIVTKDIFLQTPAELVKQIMCQRGLNLNSVLNALEKWMKYNGCKSEFYISNEINKENLELIYDIIKDLNPQFADILTTVLDFIKKYYFDKNNLLKTDDVLKEVFSILSIGGSSNGTIHSTIETYTISWSFSLPYPQSESLITVIPPMMTPRMCFAVAQSVLQPVVVYVLGGLGTSSTGKALNLCEKYDVRNNQWSEIKSMPKKVKCLAAAWVEGKIVVTGGTTEEWKTVKDVWEYLEKDNRWRPGVPMLVERSGHGAVNVMGTLYVLGGQGTSPGILHNSVERYNADLRSWSYVNEMPEAKHEFGCVALSEYIYVIGGATRHFILNSVHKYNTLTDKWEQCSVMPTPKSSFGCTVRDGRIYCVGGSDIVHGPLSTVEVYNPQTNRWHYTTDRIQTPRAYSCAATVRHYLDYI